MKRKWVLISALLLAGCTQQNPTKVDVEMFNTVGDSLGKINLTEQSSGVKVQVNLKGLKPGVHAIHIHEKAKCKAPDFKSAGNHFNPEQKEHGLLHPKGAHAGDLPNLIVEDDGSVSAELMAPNVTLKNGKKSLYTKQGTSIVIDQKKDDGMTQPSGNSGKRVACGEISSDKKSGQKNHKKKKNKIYYLGLSLVPFIPMDIHYLVHCYKGEIRLGKENRQFTGGFPQMGQMGYPQMTGGMPQTGYPGMAGGYPGMMGGFPQTTHPGMMGGYPGVPQTMGGYPYHHHHHHPHHHHHHGGYPQTGYPHAGYQQMPGTTQMGGYPQMPGTQMGGYPQMPGTQMGGYPKTGTQGYGKRSN